MKREPRTAEAQTTEAETTATKAGPSLLDYPGCTLGACDPGGSIGTGHLTMYKDMQVSDMRSMRSTSFLKVFFHL